MSEVYIVCPNCHKQRHKDTFVDGKCIVCRKGLRIIGGKIKKRDFI